MESSAYRSLAFLFSLGSLPIACNPDGDDTTDDSGGTTDSTNGTTDGTQTTTTATTGDTATEPTTGGASEPTTGGTTEPGTTTETGGGGEACEAYVAYLIKCEPEAEAMKDMYLAYCAMIRAQVEAIYGPVCLAAHDAVYECLQASDCTDETACEAEVEASNGCFPEAGAACTAFGAKEAECYDEPVPDYAAGSCQVYLNSQVYYSSPACGEALEEWFACLVDLPCVEFEMQAGCEAQRDEVTGACGGGP
ncbi:hypothetical protein [Nannocystis punicea]|uniref:Uncharacterized protein n=1 Tax=Nannocystis punicea TaxID=2995304 RepID=A0ABY7H5Q1_9BACT|nr:hypothetical protein [Nannocystis poenicansa]WAS94488.1 hypothetical protein O0S08_50875 [Nannocystis poenicansa]